MKKLLNQFIPSVQSNTRKRKRTKFAKRLAQHVYRLRIAQGLTQEQLADNAGRNSCGDSFLHRKSQTGAISLLDIPHCSRFGHEARGVLAGVLERGLFSLPYSISYIFRSICVQAYVGKCVNIRELS